MFETSIFCDKRGCGVAVKDIATKRLMVFWARENGWSIGKRHLCPNCRAKRKRRAGEQRVRDLLT